MEYVQTLRETILAAAETQTPPPPSFEEVAQSREKLKETVNYLIPGELVQMFYDHLINYSHHPVITTYNHDFFLLLYFTLFPINSFLI